LYFSLSSKRNAYLESNSNQSWLYCLISINKTLTHPTEMVALDATNNRVLPNNKNFIAQKYLQ